jgi:hypothetical protein
VAPPPAASHAIVNAYTRPDPSGVLKRPSRFPQQTGLHGAFVWARRALDSQKTAVCGPGSGFLRPSRQGRARARGLPGGQPLRAGRRAREQEPLRLGRFLLLPYNLKINRPAKKSTTRALLGPKSWCFTLAKRYACIVPCIRVSTFSLTRHYNKLLCPPGGHHNL